MIPSCLWMVHGLIRLDPAVVSPPLGDGSQARDVSHHGTLLVTEAAMPTLAMALAILMRFLRGFHKFQVSFLHPLGPYLGCFGSFGLWCGLHDHLPWSLTSLRAALGTLGSLGLIGILRSLLGHWLQLGRSGCHQLGTGGAHTAPHLCQGRQLPHTWDGASGAGPASRASSGALLGKEAAKVGTQTSTAFLDGIDQEIHPSTWPNPLVEGWMLLKFKKKMKMQQKNPSVGP